MRLKNIRRDDSALSKVMLSIIVVIILIVSSVLVVVMTMKGSGSGETVANGDVITVDYVGYMMVDGEKKVFDTTIWDVVTDNVTYPKALWYTAKTEAKCVPYSFTVGVGTVVTGFDQGVLGMEKDKTKTITIPASQGYGTLAASKLKTFDLITTVPIYVTTTTAAFKTTFGEVAAAGLSVTDPVYNWPVTVLSVDTLSDEVEYMNVPTSNAIYHVYGSDTANVVAGWDIQITSVDSTANGGKGSIVIQHLIGDADSWDIKGYSGGSLFYLIDVDTTAGTAVMNFSTGSSSAALKGQTMYFEVTIISISKSGQ
jgi:hypothetical protein